MQFTDTLDAIRDRLMGSYRDDLAPTPARVAAAGTATVVGGERSRSKSWWQTCVKAGYRHSRADGRSLQGLQQAVDGPAGGLARACLTRGYPVEQELATVATVVQLLDQPATSRRRRRLDAR